MAAEDCVWGRCLTCGDLFPQIIHPVTGYHRTRWCDARCADAFARHLDSESHDAGW